MPDFVEFVLGSFSCCYIENDYSNFTFCERLNSQFVSFHVKNVKLLAKGAHLVRFTKYSARASCFPSQVFSGMCSFS